jgi:hypothetical protein
MSWINDFDNVKSRTILKFVGLLMLVVPGLAAIYHFNRLLFLQLDDLKLILLAIVFTSPPFLILFLPAASIAMLDEPASTKAQTEDEGVGVLGATLLDLLIVNLVAFAWLLIGAIQRSSLRTYIIECMITSAVLGGVLLTISFMVVHSKGKTKQETLPLKA